MITRLGNHHSWKNEETDFIRLGMAESVMFFYVLLM